MEFRDVHGGDFRGISLGMLALSEGFQYACISFTEECQSGRMGRSRKPLCVNAYRGFESHLLRHLFSSRLRREYGESLA
jgi:hypothetical protein